MRILSPEFPCPRNSLSPEFPVSPEFPGILNNNMYGTTRMHQERHYPGRTIATDLTNPDFAQHAQSFGAFGEVVEKTEEFQPAFERALKAGRIAVLELRLDLEVISTRTTLSAMSEAAQAR